MRINIKKAANVEIQIQIEDGVLTIYDMSPVDTELVRMLENALEGRFNDLALRGIALDRMLDGLGDLQLMDKLFTLNNK